MFDEKGQRYLDAISNVQHGKIVRAAAAPSIFLCAARGLRVDKMRAVIHIIHHQSHINHIALTETLMCSEYVFHR